MKTKTNKPNLETFIHIRCTKEEKKELKDLADKYGMCPSAYGRDKLFNGHERAFYSKRKLCTTMVKLTDNIDNLYGILNRLELSPEVRSELDKCMESINVERGNLWNS